MASGLVILTSIPRCRSYAMPFYSDYGYYHGSPSSSVPFSSQYYGHHQLLLLPPYSTSNSRPAAVRTQTRNYNSMAVEQTLRAIRRGPGPASARRYCRPVHINASEIDVTTPRRPRQSVATETATAVTGDGTDGDSGGGGIHRGRTVVRLHTKNNNKKRTESWLPAAATAVTVAVTAAPAAEEGLAKKGTIKRHTSAGIKVPVNDDRRPSVTDEILREQEALFDTMIMEEMEGQRGRRRKSYPVDCVAATMVDGKQPQKNTANSKDGPRKQSAAAVMMVFGKPLSPPPQEKPAKKPANWKLNYDVIIEESGIEQPVSFTFKLNKTNESQQSAGRDDDNGKIKGDANLSNVVLERHDDNSNNDKKHAKADNIAAVKASGKNNSDHVCMTAAADKPGVTKKKIIVKKKKVVGKKDSASGELRAEKQPKRQTVLPPKLKEKGTEPAKAVAVITPFVRASFGKTFISPSQVSSTKSKFEKPKPKAKPATAAPEPPAVASTPVTLPPDSSSDDDSDTSSSSGNDGSSLSLCSDSGGGDSSSGSSSTYYDSDDYGDKRIACSNSSFDSGLPSSPVPAPEPLGTISYDAQTHFGPSQNEMCSICGETALKILWKNDRKCDLFSFERFRECFDTLGQRFLIILKPGLCSKIWRPKTTKKCRGE